jgi:hypothetical protein
MCRGVGGAWAVALSELSWSAQWRHTKAVRSCKPLRRRGARPWSSPVQSSPAQRSAGRQPQRLPSNMQQLQQLLSQRQNRFLCGRQRLTPWPARAYIGHEDRLPPITLGGHLTIRAGELNAEKPMRRGLGIAADYRARGQKAGLDAKGSDPRVQPERKTPLFDPI